MLSSFYCYLTRIAWHVFFFLTYLLWFQFSSNCSVLQHMLITLFLWDIYLEYCVLIWQNASYLELPQKLTNTNTVSVTSEFSCQLFVNTRNTKNVDCDY